MSVFFDIKSEFENYILEHDFLGLLLLDRMGFIRLANEKTGMILKCDKDHLKGRKLSSFLIRSDRERFLRYFSDSRQATQPRMENFGLISSRGDLLCLQILLFPALRQKRLQQLYRKVIILDHAPLASPVSFPSSPAYSSPSAEAFLQQRHDFMTMLTHELQNPLGAMFNALEVIKRKGKEDPAMLAWGCQTIKNQGNHIASMLRQLLEISRIGMGRLTITPEPVLVQTVLEKVMKGHSGDPVSHASPLWLYVDPAHCVQMMECLLQVAIGLNESRQEVYFEAERQGDWCVIRIMGFSSGRMNQLGGDQESDALPGDLFNGLKGRLSVALTLARHLARLHNGHIHIPDRIDAGDPVLEVWLPLVAGSTGPNR